MKRLLGLTVLMTLIAVQTATTADGPAKRTPKEALQAFHDLIGSWRATGTPEGSKAQKQKGYWQETISWEWQFKGNDAWLTVAFEKGKYFVDGELRYVADKDHYQLKLQTTEKETIAFEGKLKEHVLTLERSDEKKKETQRMVISLLHNNRYLYHYEVKPEDRGSFTRVYQVGATKEGVAFANKDDSGPECIVSGGPAAMRVTYKGQTYYVCCGGCRSEFNANPEKYIKEYEEAKAKKDKEKPKSK
ncbi:MAG: YHS domain-containing protein [Gemmataceae bacterium]|nr:YHS domain-containing protein [Gemmataceae bacterium]